jgi:hypothetical protein
VYLLLGPQPPPRGDSASCPPRSGGGGARRLATAYLAASALGVVLAAVGSVGYTLHDEQRQFSAGSYFLDAPVRATVGHLPATGCIELEGFGEAQPIPAAEGVLAYALVDEHAWGRASIPVDYDDNFSLFYFELPPKATLSNPAFCPNYQVVLTRTAGTDSNRRPVFRDGAIAVEGRASPLDVLIDYGLWIPRPDSIDKQGNGYVISSLIKTTEPTQFVVTGDMRRPVYVGLTFELKSAKVRVAVSSPQQIHVRQNGSNVAVCLKATGGQTVRTVKLHMSTASPAELIGMAASSTGCPAEPKQK